MTAQSAAPSAFPIIPLDYDAYFQGREPAVEEQYIIDHIWDREWRLRNLYWIINEKGQRVLFNPNEVQREIGANLWFLNLILKSRQHGITTYFCILYLDECLFTPNLRAGINAHSREDAESFFKDKVKYAYDNLPEIVRFMVPANTDTARELAFANNSAIRVATSLRGGTYQRIHITEFGKICAKYPEKAREIVTGTLNTVHPGQIITIESTAEGRTGYFYDYCQAAMEIVAKGHSPNIMEFKFFFFPWYRDGKNWIDPDSVVIPASLKEYFRSIEISQGVTLNDGQRAWYTAKWRLMGTDMRREYPSTPKEAFEAAIEGAYFARQFERIYRENRITAVPYEEGLPVYTFWDLGHSDTTCIWFVQVYGKQFRVIDYYENNGEGLAHYAQVLRDKGYHYGTLYAPHDIEVTELGTGKTRKEQASAYGIEFVTCPKLSKEDQIEAARNVLQFCWFDEERCSYAWSQKHLDRTGLAGLENYRKEWDEKLGAYRNKPLHDWASNPADSFELLGVMAGSLSNGPGLSGFVPKRG